MRAVIRAVKRHPRALIATAAATCAVGIVVAAFATRSSPAARPAIYTPPTRARVYIPFTACLLTGPGGIGEAASAPVWSGMETASGTTRAQVTYTAMQGPQTVANVTAYINSLALRGCSLILTSGQLTGSGVNASADTLPRNHFVTVNAPATKATNVASVLATKPAEISDDVAALVAADAKSSLAAP